MAYRKYFLLITVSGFWIALDQLLKIYIHTQFRLGESVVIVRNFFNVTYVRNTGAAFGFLSQSQPTFREVFFFLIPPIAVALIILILRSVDNRDKRQIIALSSICGGALGNYIDRLKFRYVIDFFDFHMFDKYSWPAFNIADVAIVGGVVILIYSLILENYRNKKSSDT